MKKAKLLGIIASVAIIGFLVMGCDQPTNNDVPTALPTPTGLSVNAAGVLSWTAVPGADGYRVYAGTTVLGTATGTTFNLRTAPVPPLAVGTHQISVIARGVAGTSLDSARSNAVEFVVAPVDGGNGEENGNGTPGQAGAVRNIDIRGAQALMIAPRGSVEGARSRAGITAFNTGENVLFMQDASGDWSEVSMTDAAGNEVAVAPPSDIVELTDNLVIMRWWYPELTEHLVRRSDGAVFDVSGRGLMTTQYFPYGLPTDSRQGGYDVHHLFYGQSLVHAVSANRVFVLIRDPTARNYWRVAELSLSGTQATITMITSADFNVRQFAVDSSGNILFDIGAQFMMRLAAGGTPFPVTTVPAGGAGANRRAAIPQVFSGVDGNIYFLVRQVFQDTATWPSPPDAYVMQGGVRYDYWARQLRAYRVSVSGVTVNFTPVIGEGFPARAMVSPRAQRTGGWDGFDMATSGSFLSLTPGPIGWDELRTMGLTPAGDDLFSIVDDVRAVRVAALDNWGHGFDMPNSRFNFAAGDMVSVSGTVTGTHANRHVQLNSRPGYYRPIARHFGDGSFELDVTLNADDVFAINDSYPSALRFEVRETGTTAIVRNVRIVRPNQGVIFDMVSSAEFLGAAYHLRDDDLLAALGLGRVYGEFSFVDNVRALQITTDATWGQGVDMSRTDFNFGVGDMVSVRGTVEGLGTGGRVTLNSNLGGAGNFASEHLGDGTFELGVQLTQAHISGIASGSPQALRFEVRATGATARIHNIRVVRAGDPGNGNGGDPGNGNGNGNGGDPGNGNGNGNGGDPGNGNGNGNGGDPIGGTVVAAPSFWAGIDRVFHFPDKTVIFERDPTRPLGWDDDGFAISTWPRTGAPRLSIGRTDGITQRMVNAHNRERDGEPMVIGMRDIFLRNQNRIVAINPLDGTARNIIPASLDVLNLLSHEVTGNDIVVVDIRTTFLDRQLVEIWPDGRTRPIRVAIAEEEVITLVRLR